MNTTPTITRLQVIPVAGRDGMLLNLSGAHGPFFTRNLIILTDSSGNTGIGEVPGGEKIRKTIEDTLYKIRPFIAAADLLRNKNDILYYGKMQGVVTESLTNGNFFNILNLFVDGNAETSYQFDLGNIPYLRNLTFE